MKLPIVELNGTPAQMGEAWGESCRDEIHELYEIRLKWAIHFALENRRRFNEEQILQTCRKSLPLTEECDPDGYEEFCGIGRGAGVSPEQVYVVHGLTDLRDVLAHGDAPDSAGCSSFFIAPDRSADGHLLLGQNWDLQTDNMPYVRLVVRRPNEGPDTCCLTVTGGLSMIGINSEGVAVGNTNIRTTDVRIGVQYLSTIHRAAKSPTLEDAVSAVTETPR
ncbi:MAG: C45 family autoproteolytic acyltransferase/hydrolase, partial [Planctomycetota bacterium]|nr:C45 family autoproteolytic acyltransferase/hydrolase [Planctomycetota bacterium]